MRKVENTHLSLITVTRNDRSGLARTFQSLESQEIEPSKWERIEWIVIDGASTDDTQEFVSLIKFKGKLTFLSEPDFGIFDAMNKGCRMASGKSVLFLNAGDALAERDILESLINLIKKNHNFIISGKVRMHWNQYVSVSDLAPWVCHQAVVVPKNILIKYPFDANKKFFGDLHLWMRLKNDNLFSPHRVDLVICDFYLGGVGNNPKYLWKRFIERRKISVEFNDGSSYVSRLLLTIFFITIAALFGKTAYYKTMWFTSDLLHKFRN